MEYECTCEACIHHLDGTRPVVRVRVSQMGQTSRKRQQGAIYRRKEGRLAITPRICELPDTEAAA